MFSIRAALLSILWALPQCRPAQPIDCLGDIGAHPYLSYTREFQEAACLGGACNDQFEQHEKTWCELHMLIGGGWRLNLVAIDPDKTYKNCNSTVSDIIDACFSKGNWWNGEHGYTNGYQAINTPEYYHLNATRSDEDLVTASPDWNMDGKQVTFEDNAPPQFEEP